jgi:hypothetical protein
MTPLRWLDFEISEGDDGTTTLDALTSVRPADRDALAADIVRVLDWAHTRYPGVQGPVEEGGDWDFDLQLVESATGATLHYDAGATLHYDAGARRLVWPGDVAAPPRLTVALTLSGSVAFCSALSAAFGLDGPAHG